MHTSLAERFRPSNWQEFVGQDKIMAKEHILHSSIARKTPVNLLFWGPPGTGKTSAARVYVRSFDKPIYDMHPSTFSAPRIKEVLESAEKQPLFRPALFWIDEIHRLTTPQQDLLLRAMENGLLVVVGATTENPSFCLRPALLSRMQALRFEPLKEKDLGRLLERLLEKCTELSLEDEAKLLLARLASGDARRLLSFLDVLLMQSKEGRWTVPELEQMLFVQAPGGIASSGEGRYLLISALHKAVRGSDVDASLYWFARLLEAKEDPVYIARRLIRMAIEDVGLADPEALKLAEAAFQAYKSMGSPEGDLALAEVVVYLALSPKSASCYVAFDKAKALALETRHILPPAHILNAPTQWMEKEGFGAGYIWEHACPGGVSGQSFWPKEMSPTSLYEPVERGFERELAKRFQYFQRIRKKLGSGE